jgi:hypothetical protein
MQYMIVKCSYDTEDGTYFSWEMKRLPVEHDRGHAYVTSFASKADAINVANAELENENKQKAYKTWRLIPEDAKPGKMYLVSEAGRYRTYCAILGVK